MAYVNFDGLVSRFENQIYQTRKGRLRMYLIDALYKRYLPMNDLQHYRVLDAAGGLGQMSEWFLAHGSEVDYFDISNEMVEAVKSQLTEFEENNQFSATQASITEHKIARRYDVVNVHAVLEWLESPMEALSNIVSWVEVGGYLGLMVYNKHMLMLRHLMRGTLSKAMTGQISGDKKGLTPISPIDPNDIRNYLQESGFTVLAQAGIRSFSDLAEQTVIDWYDEKDVFSAELTLCEDRPYCDLARYVLFIAKKN